jgi:cbb3-type cytochrome oxidase maturation protein
MSAFYIMIGVSLVIAVGFLAAFIWSVQKGHYEDEYTPSIRILLDDTKASEQVSKTAKIQ